MGTKHIRHTPLIYSIENVYQVQDKNGESLEFDALMQKIKELQERVRNYVKSQTTEQFCGKLPKMVDWRIDKQKQLHTKNV